MIVQIIGLPCSGKTYVLKKIKKNFDTSFLRFFDFSSLQSLPEEYDSNFINIIESAQGLDIETDFVLKLKIPTFFHKKNCKSRQYYFSLAEESQIDYYSIPAHFNVYSQKELYKILSFIIKNRVQNANILKGVP